MLFFFFAVGVRLHILDSLLSISIVYLHTLDFCSAVTCMHPVGFLRLWSCCILMRIMKFHHSLYPYERRAVNRNCRWNSSISLNWSWRLNHISFHKVETKKAKANIKCTGFEVALDFLFYFVVRVFVPPCLTSHFLSFFLCHMLWFVSLPRVRHVMSPLLLLACGPLHKLHIWMCFLSRSVCKLENILKV